MITIPPSKPEKWHKRFEWVKYANVLFRYYSRRGDYALRLEQAKGMIASVDPRTRIVRLNPDFVTAPLQYVRTVRHSPARMREHIIASMKGYLAHEAAHVRFSSEKPAGLLGQIWNSIEDERIERLMAASHPDLAGIFTHIGDIHLTRSWDQLTFTPLEGVLTWRWAHDHPTLRWASNDPDTWARVRPHVEAAWVESDPDMVEEHAKRILEELKLPEDAQAPEIMSGPFVTCPDPEPGQNHKGSKGKKQKGQQDQDDQAGGGGQGEQADDSEQGSSGKGRSQGQEEDDQAQGGDQQGDPQEDSQGAGQGDDQDDQAGQEGDDQDESDQTSGGGDENGDDTSTSSGDGDDEADDDDGDPYSNDGGYEGGAGGAGVGYPGFEPSAPEVVPEDPNHVRAREILRDVEGHGRDLAAALALPDAPNLRVSHESRGRFDYGRYATGAQRQFRYKQHKGRKELPRITLLHDNSGSMGGHRPTDAQYHAVRATMMLQRACELSRTPLNVISFHHNHSYVTNDHDDPEVARGKIGGIHSTGGTNLAPALRTALAHKHPSRKRHVIVIYCDGHIDTRDATQCQRLAKQHPDTFILPILIGPKTQAAQFDHAFGRSLQVHSADELASKLKSWVSANLHT